MRRRASVLLLLVPVGCFSASSGGSAPDANFNPQGDADFTDTGAEATAADASVDSPLDASMDVTVKEASIDAPVEAGLPPVTVLVTNAAGPEPGVTVVFQQATGAVITSAVTGATGTISQVQPSGIQVTVILGTAAAPSLFTVEGAAPGDTLAVYDPSADSMAGPVSVDSLPSGTPVGTASYNAYVGDCQGSGTALPLVVSVGAACESEGKFPVLVTAYSAGGAPLGSAWQKGNALSLDGGTTHVTVGGTWSAAIDTQTVSTDAPPAFALADGDNGYLSFSAVATGVNTNNSNTYFGGIGADDAGVSGPFPYPAGFPDFLQGEANVTNYGTTGGNLGVSVSAIATRAATPAGDSTTSLALSQLLPQIQSATIDSTNPVQPTVAWDTGDAGSVASADGVVAAFTWTGNDDGGFVSGRWTIVAPPTASSIQVPALPTAQARLAPFAGAFFSNQPAVLIVEASFLPGYAQLRAQAGTAALLSAFNSNLSFSSSNPTVVPPLPVNGTLRMTAFTANGD